MQTTINLGWLKDHNACSSGVSWFKAQKERDTIKIIHKLVAKERFDWANWIITRNLTQIQNVQYAVFSAELVLHIYTEYNSNDKRPARAITKAKKYLAAADAAYAAYAADAAAYAAYAAADAYAAAADPADAKAAYAAARKSQKTDLLVMIEKWASES